MAKLPRYIKLIDYSRHGNELYMNIIIDAQQSLADIRLKELETEERLDNG